MLGEGDVLLVDLEVSPESLVQDVPLDQAGLSLESLVLAVLDLLDHGYLLADQVFCVLGCAVFEPHLTRVVDLILDAGGLRLEVLGQESDESHEFLVAHVEFALESLENVSMVIEEGVLVLLVVQDGSDEGVLPLGIGVGDDVLLLPEGLVDVLLFLECLVVLPHVHAHVGLASLAGVHLVPMYF